MTPTFKTSRTYPASASALAFPLGGIGTGNVSLGARGELRDWEIFNRPAKGNALPNTFFALRAQAGRCGRPSRRCWKAPIQPPHHLSHGYHPQTAAGCRASPGPPSAASTPSPPSPSTIPTLPVEVAADAYTPLIPLNPADSGLPCAILTYTPHQSHAPSRSSLTLVGSLINPVGGVALDRFGNHGGGRRRRQRQRLPRRGGLRGLHLTSTQYPADHLRYGDLSLATTHEHVTVKRAWLRAGWYDFLREFWSDLTDDGLLTDLGYDDPSEPGKTDTGSLGLLDTPRARRDARLSLHPDLVLPQPPR